jgi:hypothetical protein
LPEQSAPIDLSSLSSASGVVKMLGIDKMINIDAFRDCLNNMSPEDIDNATASVKDFLGDIDDDTTQVITEVFHDVADEFRKNNISNGNALDDIMRVAENIGPKIASKNINMQKLINSTKNAAEKMNKNNNAKKMFNGADPFGFLTKMMDKASEAGNDGQCDVNPDEMAKYMEECKNMLSGMNVNMNINDMVGNNGNTKNANSHGNSGSHGKRHRNHGGRNKK